MEASPTATTTPIAPPPPMRLGTSPVTSSSPPAGEYEAGQLRRVRRRLHGNLVWTRQKDQTPEKHVTDATVDTLHVVDEVQEQEQDTGAGGRDTICPATGAGAGVREHRELRQTMAEDMLEPGRRPEASDRTDKIEGWSLSRDGFVLRPCGRPFMIEIFAGSGRLTRALRHRGFDAWAVDWRGRRLQSETPFST